MTDDPLDDDDEPPPTDPRSLFLAALWSEMDRAEEFSTGGDVMDRLPEVEAHLDAALALVRRWRQENP